MVRDRGDGGELMQPGILAEALVKKLRSPLLTILGSPREVAEVLAEAGIAQTTCYQMDLYQAERLGEELTQRQVAGEVVTRADLWDLAAGFRTAWYPAAEGGERGLKIDMVEQAFHVLGPHGQLVVTSPYEADQLFPGLLKK